MERRIPLKAARKPMGCSKITNGAVFVPGVDHRNTWIRRARDLIAGHTADLGGDCALSEAQRSIIRRAAVLATECERMEKDFAIAGEASPDALDLYQRTSGSLRRLLESIGIDTRVSAAPVDLKTYLQGKAAR